MIKINLCPIDELESQYWYVPDLAMALAIALVSFFGVQYYLGSIQDQIDQTTAQVQSLTENTNKLKPDLERFKNLSKNIGELNQKLTALKAITVSKIAKYEPVIVLEHFQNLKPEGVWLTSLKIGVTQADGFEMKGQALDNVLTAEFITAVRSTGSQELDQGDIRTAVYFDHLVLEGTQVALTAPPDFPELASYPEFTLKGTFQERQSAAAPEGESGEETGAAAPVSEVRVRRDAARL